MTRADRQGRLADAEARFEASPEDADALLCLGRRLGYLGRYRLLLLYKGELGPDEVMAEVGEPGSIGFATVGYGVANWHLVNGREAEAMTLFESIVAGGQWASFGHLAAEAELGRRGRRWDL